MEKRECSSRNRTEFNRIIKQRNSNYRSFTVKLNERFTNLLLALLPYHIFVSLQHCCHFFFLQCLEFPLKLHLMCIAQATIERTCPGQLAIKNVFRPRFRHNRLSTSKIYEKQIGLIVLRHLSSFSKNV